MEQSLDTTDQTPAQQQLKRAFVLTSYGFFQEALQSCERAANLSDDELVPRTIQGAILTASGRPSDAMKVLIRLQREHKNSILCSLYLAEACFLAGRHRRGWKTLNSLEEEAVAQSPWAEFYQNLRTAWEELEEIEGLPGPLRVPMGEDDDER